MISDGQGLRGVLVAVAVAALDCSGGGSMAALYPPDAGGTVVGPAAHPVGTQPVIDPLPATGRLDGGVDAGGGGVRAGNAGGDAGVDGGDAGGGTATRADAGMPPPWPAAKLTVYGAAQGILELPVVAAQPDEANNIWLVTHAALYLLRPGDQAFTRFDDSDGLHVGLSQPPGITGVAGGASDQAFVGYEGWVDGSPNTDTQAEKDMGKFDRVDLLANGALAVTRFNVHDSDSINYWENRSVRRFLYDHTFHPGTLYVGMNHGVDRVNGDSYADHDHVEVCIGGCTSPSHPEMIGEWRGLALDAKGDLWMAGQYSAGLLGWTPGLLDWLDNNVNPFLIAFGDPYPPWQPVFYPPAEGDSVDIRAVAVAPDGLVWFASGPEWSDSDPEYGIASYEPGPGTFAYYDPIALGFGTKALVDMVALPDGRLVFGTEYDGLRIWDPRAGTVASFTTTQGLPGDQIQLMYLDPRTSPPALFVGTDGGLALFRP